MLSDFCAPTEGLNAPVYLETDKLEIVLFYEKFGFVTIIQSLVPGAPN
jgi:hypothetical protein